MPPLAWLLAGSVALGLLVGGIQTIRLDHAQNALLALEKGIAVEAARSAQEVASKKEADAARTRDLAQQAETIKTAVKDQISASTAALAKVVSNPVCRSTPASGAFDSSVRLK